MPESLDIESKEFFELLTDALRAGPGSPQWHQAVETLKGEQGGNMDEYALLYQAREHLESGKGYREVRAGPGFTRKVMEAVDEESRGTIRKGPSTATWIAIFCGLVVVAMLGVLAWSIVQGKLGEQEAIKRLEQTIFADAWISTNFETATGGEQWQAIGSLPLSVGHGLAPTSQPVDTKADYVGGGLSVAFPVPADQSYAVEATIRMPAGTNDGTIVQLFVSDEAKFAEDRGTTAHELVCMIQNGLVKVARPDGSVVDTELAVAGLAQPVLLRIAFNRDAAAVDAGGKRVWAGGNQLNHDRPRHVGVRFLQRGGGAGAGNGSSPVVESLRVMRPK